MTFRQGTKYALTHCWLWPLILWMRPLSLIEDARKNQRVWSELATATLAGFIWGSLFGIVISKYSGNSNYIWLLSISFSLIFASIYIDVGIVDNVDNIVSVVVGTFGVVGGVGGIVVGVVAGGVIGVGVGITIGVVGGIVGGVGVVILVFIVDRSVGAVVGDAAGDAAAAGTVIGSIIIYYGVVLLGVSFNKALINNKNEIMYIFIFIDFLFIFFGILVARDKKNSNWKNIAFGVICFFLLPVSSFSFFFNPRKQIDEFWLLAIFLVFFLALGLGGISGFFKGEKSRLKSEKAQWQRLKQVQFLLFFWSFFPILSLGGYWFNPEKLYWLVLILTPVFFTGLPFYPFLVLASLWQSRKSFVERQSFQKLIPYRWQSFAYPLPGMHRYLKKLAQRQGGETAWNTLQELQIWTLQVAATKKAALKLAQELPTAFSFVGAIAIHTNTRTLYPFALASQAASSIAILGKAPNSKKDLSEKYPLLFYLGEFPPPSSVMLWLSFFQNQKKKEIQEFLHVQETSLSQRVTYALSNLQVCQAFEQYSEYHQFLSVLISFLEIQTLEELLTVTTKHNLYFQESHLQKQPSWLQGGWQILLDFYKRFSSLEEYRNLRSEEARREFLTVTIQQLKAQTWEEDLPEFWRNLGQEFGEHLVLVFQKEREEVREWLSLELSLEQAEWSIGKQRILFSLQNPTGILAREIRLQVQEGEGFYCSADHVRYPLLEGGDTTQLALEIDFQKQGPLILEGELQAVDLLKNPLQKKFSFRIDVGEKGILYHPPEVSPYHLGEGLAGNHFVGRKELFHWLRSLWKQPDGKPAIVLVGQRRIGKTSLLNWIQYEGLQDLNLLPVLIDVQNCTSAYDFLQETAWGMAGHFELNPPDFNPEEVYADFKRFLLSLRERLGQRRFLLMLDEADLIPQRNLGELLPGFLRSLMQGRQFPTLLLFCGTHALKRMGREYDSILFNTAQMRVVSYMTPAESAEVLCLPTKEILEFDASVLKEAYRLTRGQPLLLQMIGDKLIQNLNQEVFDGETPNNFINLIRLQEAVESLTRDESNMAFESYWKSSEGSTHQILSVAAWATTNREQINIEGLEDALQKHRFPIARKPLFDALQELTEEEILIQEGGTYRFVIPLYREWVNWRWPPSLIRTEG